MTIMIVATIRLAMMGSMMVVVAIVIMMITLAI